MKLNIQFKNCIKKHSALEIQDVNDFYTENYKTLLRGIKEYQNK